MPDRFANERIVNQTGTHKQEGDVVMAYKRKTRDRWDIETNYGYGWEVENSEYTREDARRSFREGRTAGIR